MKEIKKLTMRIIFVFEIAFFAFIYFRGSHGLVAIRTLQCQNNNLITDVDVLYQEIDTLEAELEEWNTNSFYKEKIAREQLQMICPNEELYIT